MAGEDWSDEENDAIVADYFAMLADDAAGHAYNKSDRWCLLRLWNFSRAPKAFELRPPLDRHVELTPTSFQAGFR